MNIKMQLQTNNNQSREWNTEKKCFGGKSLFHFVFCFDEGIVTLVGHVVQLLK